MSFIYILYEKYIIQIVFRVRRLNRFKNILMDFLNVIVILLKPYLIQFAAFLLDSFYIFLFYIYYNK